jgi:hypothetical protein
MKIAEENHCEDARLAGPGCHSPSLRGVSNLFSDPQLWVYKDTHAPPHLSASTTE